MGYFFSFLQAYIIKILKNSSHAFNTSMISDIHIPKWYPWHLEMRYHNRVVQGLSKSEPYCLQFISQAQHQNFNVQLKVKTITLQAQKANLAEPVSIMLKSLRFYSHLKSLSPLGNFHSSIRLRIQIMLAKAKGNFSLDYNQALLGLNRPSPIV